MKNFLNTIRMPVKGRSLGPKLAGAFSMLLLGIGLGIFSKWLDSISINSGIWWHRLLSGLDLRNVFSELGIWICLAVAVSVFSKTPFEAGIRVFLFFIGMNVSYHLYSILFCGFNPSGYMRIWYGITLVTPFLAFLCWYARGDGGLSFFLSTGILAVMLLLCFGIGIWYFDFRRGIDTLLFIATAGILYRSPKKSAFSLVGALILAFGYKIAFPYF